MNTKTADYSDVIPNKSEEAGVSIIQNRGFDNRRCVFTLQSSVELPVSPAEVFPFFADARNLDAITPAFLRFRVLTPGQIQLKVGARIDYSLRVHGLPLRWTSEITIWDPPHRFVDVQIRGPYRLWHHEHVFEGVGDSTRVLDTVNYACPGGPLIHSLFVRRDLIKIFEYRRQVLASHFSKDRHLQGRPMRSQPSRSTY